jgi:ribonuclease VapC
MVVDTSALIVVLLREPDAAWFDRALADAPIRLMSAVTRVELSLVIEGRKGDAGRASVEQFLREVPFDVVSVTPQQADIAI